MSYGTPAQGQQASVYPTPYNTPYVPVPNPPPYGPTTASQPYGPPSPQPYGPPSSQYGPPSSQYPPGPYPPPQGPVINQPSPAPNGPPTGWMNLPQGISANCPAGLAYLTTIDKLFIHKEVDITETLTGFETENKFVIKNTLGQKIYYAVEESDCFTRNCCGPLRPFRMKILDNFTNEIVQLHRPLACDSCFFPCCLQSIEVSSPPGHIVGTVEQEWSMFCPSFAIKNASDDTVLKIEGPLCSSGICGPVEYKIKSCDGSVQVGKICKQLPGLLREVFTDQECFGISFPLDLDVRMKAVMLGACFLIESMQ